MSSEYPIPHIPSKGVGEESRQKPMKCKLQNLTEEELKTLNRLIDKMNGKPKEEEKPKHSKLPWSISYRGYDFLGIVDDDGDNVQVAQQPLGKSNAKLIVRSVNTLPKLIEAAKNHTATVLVQYLIPSELVTFDQLKQAIKEAEGEL